MYGAPGELPALGRVAGGRGRRADRGQLPRRSPTTGPSGGGSSTGRSCSTRRLRVRPPWEAPGHRAARPRDRPRPRVRDRRASDHVAVPRADARAARGRRCLRRPRLRLRGARDRGREARVRARAGARLRSGGDRGHRARTPSATASSSRPGGSISAPSRVPAEGTVAANLLAPLLREWARGGDVPADRVIASGLLEHEGDGVAAAFAERGACGSASAGPRGGLARAAARARATVTARDHVRGQVPRAARSPRPTRWRPGRR